jgi:hypothetical protein
VPLFLRVDPGDVRVLAEALQPHFEAPTLILYDRVPNGVGLAERLFRIHREILGAALRLAEKCACRSGCPSCVGPSSGLGARTKGVSINILRGLLGEEFAVELVDGPDGRLVDGLRGGRGRPGDGAGEAAFDGGADQPW